MKKTYKLDHPKIKMPRIVESIKHDIKKYLKKERSNKLPSGTKYWGFDCKLGQSEEAAVAIELSELTSGIDNMAENNITTIYIEMTAKALTTLEK